MYTTVAPPLPKKIIFFCVKEHLHFLSGMVSSPHGNWRGLSVPLDAREVELDNTTALLLSLHVPCYPCANMRVHHWLTISRTEDLQSFSRKYKKKRKEKRNIFSLGHRKTKHEKATLFLSLFQHLSFPLFFCEVI